MRPQLRPRRAPSSAKVRPWCPWKAARVLSARLHASPSRRGVPAQLPLGSAEQALYLALISSGISPMSAMSERFVRGALGTRGAPHRLPQPCAFRGAGNHPALTRGLAMSGQALSLSRSPPALLTPGWARRGTGSRRTCTGPGRSSPSRPAPSSSRSCSLCRRTSSWGRRTMSVRHAGLRSPPGPARPGRSRSAPRAGGTHLLREPGREYGRCGVPWLSPAAPRARRSGRAHPEGGAGPGHSSMGRRAAAAGERSGPVPLRRLPPSVCPSVRPARSQLPH